MKRLCLLLLCLSVIPAIPAWAEEAPVMSWASDGVLKVTYAGKTAEFTIPPLLPVQVTDEAYDSIAVYNTQASPYNRATALKSVWGAHHGVNQACIAGTISLKTRNADGTETTWQKGVDFEQDPNSGHIGRLPDGGISKDTPVLASYQYYPMRIDSVYLQDGELKLQLGTPDVVMPEPPAIPEGAVRVGNVFTDPKKGPWTNDSLFPILEVKAYKPLFMASEIAPKTLKKLEAGEHVKILAWGDSVTENGYLPDSDRWQVQFVERLRKRFPKAEIELVSRGWGGRAITHFLAEPAGSPRNYQETVLAEKPDLIISEFVNDAYLDENGVNQLYGRVLKDFRELGIEWVILTPHYTYWGNEPQNHNDEDTRPYVHAVRKFAAENHVGLADGSFLYGQLYRRGIPYVTLMTNNINHPNAFGLSLFADALMAMFD